MARTLAIALTAAILATLLFVTVADRLAGALRPRPAPTTMARPGLPDVGRTPTP
jgi:hypothetical protein